MGFGPFELARKEKRSFVVVVGREREGGGESSFMAMAT